MLAAKIHWNQRRKLTTKPNSSPSENPLPLKMATTIIIDFHVKKVYRRQKFVICKFYNNLINFNIKFFRMECAPSGEEHIKISWEAVNAMARAAVIFFCDYWKMEFYKYRKHSPNHWPREHTNKRHGPVTNWSITMIFHNLWIPMRNCHLFTVSEREKNKIKNWIIWC